MIYQVFGRGEFEIYNKITVLNISETPPVFSELSPNWNFPDKRRNHCSFVVNSDIYIFGGVSDTGVYYNDIWKYDIVNNYWKEISATGNIPSPRELFAWSLLSLGGLVIFGGTDGTNIFNDIYYFNTLDMKWVLLNNDGSGPTARFGSCICLDESRIYIVGGQNYIKPFAEIWIYTYHTNTFSLLK